MQKTGLWSVAVPVIFLTSLSIIATFDNREEFALYFSLYSVSFIAYILVIHSKRVSFPMMAITAISGHLIFLFSTPSLSNDFFRFLWDGELINAGINPYDFRPNELMESVSFPHTEYFNDLYYGMSSLSRNNYSCYPVFNQFYFAVATFFSDHVLTNLFLLRVLILITYIPAYLYAIKILKHIGVCIDRIWVLFLNPLWIVETVGNVHFEGVMVSFMLMGIYFLLNRVLIKGSLLIVIAIQIKLIPLLILPFFYRYLGTNKALIHYGLVIIGVLISSLLLIDPDNFNHFKESLLLYFRAFEFNSFVFHYYMEYGYWRYGWWRNKAYSFQLSNLVIFIISLLSLYGDIDNATKLLRRFTIGLFIYLVLSTTVHPWYLLPLLSFGIFTNFTFPLIWTFLVFLSYSAYSDHVLSESIYRILVNIEYISILIIFFIELFRKAPVLPIRPYSSKLSS